MTSQDRDIALELKRRILAAGIPLVRLTVFGSRARGDAQEDSDLDVLVVLREVDATLRRAISDLAWEVGYEREILIQTIVKTRHAIEDTFERSSLFMEAIRQDGIPV